MAKITYSNKSYLNQNPSVPSANKVEDVDMNEIKTVVNGNYDEMIGELYYKATDEMIVGSTDTNSDYIAPGYISASTAIVFFTIITPKKLDNINSIIIDSVNIKARTSQGYLNSNVNYVEYVNATGYTLSASVSSSNSILITITKSSAFTNATNNTPIVIDGYIKLTFA